ncbi:hypothetical protein T09_6679 [Trichinella sp. T9]|nr:hypothetical protein T09_6679 [Trichinella sp. T9]
MLLQHILSFVLCFLQFATKNRNSRRNSEQHGPIFVCFFFQILYCI